MSNEALTFSRLESADEVSGFLCQEGEGAADLEDFLRNDALNYERRSLSRTYLSWLGEHLVAFATLSCGSLRFQREAAQVRTAADLEDVSFVIPGVLLGRLGVDDRFRGRGFGVRLFTWAVYIAREGIAPLAGCRFLFVDAYMCRREWYEARGCRLVDRPKENPTDTVKMCFDLFPPLDPALALWEP
jgi:GNAT superfamily N-acetyltransferase